MGCASSTAAAAAPAAAVGLKKSQGSDQNAKVAALDNVDATRPIDTPDQWNSGDTAKFAGEDKRMTQLCLLGVLRTAPEPRFDHITKLMASIFKTPVALVSLIEESTLWMKSIEGPFGACISRYGSMCSMVLVPPNPTVLVVEDMTADARFLDNEFVAGPPYARFYAGAPLVGSGDMRYGTLCVVDVKPRRFKAELLQTLINFAELVVREMEREKAQRRELLKADAAGLSRDLTAYEAAVALVDVGHIGWQILYANDAWAADAGLSVDECMQRGLWQLLKPVAPDAALGVQAAISRGEAVQLHVSGGSTLPSATSLRLTLRPSSDALSSEILVGLPGFVEMGGAVLRGSGTSGVSSSTTTTSTPANAASLWFVLLEKPAKAAETPAAALPVRRPSLELQPFGLGRPERYAGLKLGPLLSSDSCGRVHRGVYQGRLVTVKMIDLPAGTGVRDEQLPKVLQEGLLSKDIAHPNLVKTLDYSIYRQQDRATAWIIQQHCNHGLLTDALDRGWLRQQRSLSGAPAMDFILRTAVDIASAMAYLHAHSVLHGGLSGASVLLTSSKADPRSFTALVGDFGVSSLRGNSATKMADYGAISHMAPEVLSESAVTAAADVFSFGVCLWEMFTSTRAWCGHPPAQIIAAVVKGRGALHLPEGAPQGLKELVAKCMEPVPSLRPTFDEVVGALRGLQVAAAQEGAASADRSPAAS